MRLRSPFSDREREVADLIGDNLGYKEIGARLGISFYTVQHYVVRAAGKIECDEWRVRPEPRVAVYAYVIHQRLVAPSL